MNTRTRWSGVKITSVSAITPQASPQPPRHEDHPNQADAANLSWPLATRATNHQLICSPTRHVARKKATHAQAGNSGAGGAATLARLPRPAQATQITPVLGAADGPAADGCRGTERRLHARRAGVLRSQPVIGLSNRLMQGCGTAAGRPFWQAGLVQECWGHVLASQGTVSAVAA